MIVVVIIPTGPGHEDLAIEAVRSVKDAWIYSQGPFSDMTVVPVFDLEGKLGRSAARNQGLDSFPADWHFLLDADDKMMPEALELVDLEVAATFGAVCLNGKVPTNNRYPLSRAQLFTRGPVGTLSMGCFVRGDLGLRFNETMDVGEDFDFYMRLPDFTKRRESLVDIGYSKDTPGAGGPRSSQDCDWTAECWKVIEQYRTAHTVRGNGKLVK